MMGRPLQISRYSQKIFFRPTTRNLGTDSLQLFLRAFKIGLVIDVTKHPDSRIAEFTEFISCHVSQGHTANILTIERLAEVVQTASETKNVLVISAFGTDRAPTICALADPSHKQELLKEGLPRMEFFRSLL